MHKMIIDTDPGVDDTMAIAFAHLHPDIELLGLTTVFGNVRVDFSTRNAQYVLNVLRARDVAVARGAAVPLQQAPLPHADFVHGMDGLGNVYPGSQSGKAAESAAVLDPEARYANIEEVDAADFIIQSARQFPGEVTLVAIGPLTNVAEALQREPQLPSLVKGLVIMGGTVDEPGNVSPVTEANFLNDPHAADALLAADWPVTLVGLDVTHRIMLTDTHLRQLDVQGGDIGSLIWQCSRFYVDFYSNSGAAREADEPQCAMHDATAVAYVLDPEAFTIEKGAARVVHDGIAIGQLIVDRKGYAYPLSHWQDRPATGVCMAVDAERVRELFLQTIINHHSS